MLPNGYTMEQQALTWDDFKETRKQIDVVRFINALGYKRSQKQFSVDVGKGIVKTNEKGLFTRRMVHQYCKRHLIGGKHDDGANPEGYEAQKLRLQVEKLERENEEGQFKFDVLKGRYIPRNEMFLHLAARASILDAGVEQFFRAKSQDFISLVGGDQSKGPDFIDAMIAGWKDLLDSYAHSEEMEVMFTGEEIASDDA